MLLFLATKDEVLIQIYCLVWDMEIKFSFHSLSKTYHITAQLFQSTHSIVLLTSLKQTTIYSFYYILFHKSLFFKSIKDEKKNEIIFWIISK